MERFLLRATLFSGVSVESGDFTSPQAAIDAAALAAKRVIRKAARKMCQLPYDKNWWKHIAAHSVTRVTVYDSEDEQCYPLWQMKLHTNQFMLAAKDRRDRLEALRGKPEIPVGYCYH